jgi:hypothetical protein
MQIRRHLADRLGEPIHLNLLSLLVLAFGDIRAKIDFDLISRRPYAFGVLKAADILRGFRMSGPLYALEFGVASGDGLISMARIAERVTKATGVEINVVGFDTGTGLPPPRDYRDHPEYYATSDYPPIDKERLKATLPRNYSIVYGDINDTVREFLDHLSGVVGFVSIDVDYYWSARESLRILSAQEPEKYLPVIPVYFDDVLRETMNSSCGELLSIAEFNATNPMRRIEPFTGLRKSRIFKNAPYLDQMHALHVLDHVLRSVEGQSVREQQVLENRYL